METRSNAFNYIDEPYLDNHRKSQCGSKSETLSNNSNETPTSPAQQRTGLFLRTVKNELTNTQLEQLEQLSAIIGIARHTFAC
jgi:hypothetical protein